MQPKILEKEYRIRKLESVESELSTENLTLKNAWSPLTGTHAATETTEEILRTEMFLKKRAEFPVRKSLEVLGLPWTYHRWVVTQGKGKRPEGVLPKEHWILPEEREAILVFKRKHPSLGAKRLSFMRLDRNVAAVSPASVWRVLQDAGLSSK